MESFGIFLFSSSILILEIIKRNIKNSDRKHNYEIDITPPLPQEAVNILSISKLCHLATCTDNEPHLSLMNFTYYQSDEVIILCTRRNTKKYFQLLNCKKVAILVHDFPHIETESQYNQTFSITLNGIVSLMQDNDDSSMKYRNIHLIKNPKYEQFIVGNDIAVIIVKIDTARICDITDKVTYWSKYDSK